MHTLIITKPDVKKAARDRLYHNYNQDVESTNVHDFSYKKLSSEISNIKSG